MNGLSDVEIVTEQETTMKPKPKKKKKPNKPYKNRLLMSTDKYISINDNIRYIKKYWEMSDEYIRCNFRNEYILNQTIKTLYAFKYKNFMNTMICNNIAKLGWRTKGFTPFITGNKCEPWWSRDIVYVISKLLNKNMKVLEYGSGTSTLWMSLFSKHILSMEGNKGWVDGLKNISNSLSIKNIDVFYERFGRRYVEPSYAGIFDNNIGNLIWNNDIESHKIDFIVIDGRLRKNCIEFALKYIKSHGGILLLDNSDRNNDDGINATKLIPNHWLRIDSYILDQHLFNVNQSGNMKWLSNSQTTIWVSRDKSCFF